jgi:hypothetical protein
VLFHRATLPPMQPSIAPHEPFRARPSAGDDASALALRLSAGVDVDRLAEEIGRAWRSAAPARRDAADVALSVVETCGRTPGERERDALRVLRDERRAAGSRGTLRATLVSLGAREHLLLLAAAPGTTALQALSAIAEDLERLYPVATVALG